MKEDVREQRITLGVNIMDKYAIFIDAGYFWTQLSYLFYGEKREREDISLNTRMMRECLIRRIQNVLSGERFLRIYWYDACEMNGLPTKQHKIISSTDGIKIRYGLRNSAGVQKGVDGLLTEDLTGLARNRAITSGVIVSGDADLLPGICKAQEYGVTVCRLDLPGREASSPQLCQEVDRNIKLDESDIHTFARKIENGENGALHQIAVDFVTGLSEDEKRTMTAVRSLPYEIDKKLLYSAKTSLDRPLEYDEKITLRGIVMKLCA